MSARRTPHGAEYPAHRPVVMGRRGMVCSGHPLASQAGVQVLQRGGNAVDAAVATGAALNVVEPQSSGIGGDGFIMIYIRDRSEIKVANATGAAPFGATRERYLPHGIPMKGILSVSVPGLLKGWAEAQQRYGRMKLGEVLDPAIDLADNGFPVSHRLARDIAADPLISQFPTSREIFVRDGRMLAPGEMLYQQDLARTFQLIASQGADVLYEGEIAHAIARFSEELQGLLTLEDLAAHAVRWQDPIQTTYRGFTVYEAPPNSSGVVLLQELNMIECFDLRALGCNTPECIHLMVEAKKLAFADREAYVADPEFVDVPVEGLLSKPYARERAASIRTGSAALSVLPGDPWKHQRPVRAASGRQRGHFPTRQDTTCFCIIDQWGNAVSQLQSIQSGFGSSLVARGTGILLNNRMTYWHLEEDHVDRLEPGKRVRHTMNPVMVFRERPDDQNRDLVVVCGTPGADTQVQTNMQVLTHVLDFGMSVAEAVEAPRWRHLQNPTESTVPHTCVDELWLEGRFSQDAVSELKAYGHPVKAIGDWDGPGSEMMIQVDAASGAKFGAADPRRDGYSIGW